MRDWKALVREHLDLTTLDDGRQDRIVEELACQIEDVHAEALAEGASPEEAERRALALIPDWERLSANLARGSRVHRRSASERLLESSADRLGPRGGAWSLLANLAHDLKFTLRSLRRAPVFWAVTVPILALGIGAATTIFSIADGVLLKRLPYTAANRLVEFLDPAFSAPAFQDWQEYTTSYDVLAAEWRKRVDYVAGETPEQLRAGLVTPGYFDLFDAYPAAGRLFLPADFDGAPNRAVLSHGAWLRLFGGNASVIGKAIELDGQTVTVVGVLARGFVSPQGLSGDDNDVWIALDPRLKEIQRPGFMVLAVYGRLRDGVSPAAAQKEKDQHNRRLAAERPDVHRNFRGEPRMIKVAPLHSALVGDTAKTVRLLLGAVLLLMLIACANVAHIFLARGTARYHELAVRSALGAGRRRLAAQLLTESISIALAGGILGALLAFAGVGAFRALNPGDIPLVQRVAVDLRALGFAVVLSLLTGVIFGLAPAWQAARARGTALRDNRRSGGTRERTLLRNMLVVSEIALSLVLLTGAGLLFHSFVRLRTVAPGFNVDHLAAVELGGGSEYTDDQRRDLVARLLDRVDAMPGVEHAALAWSVPFQYPGRMRLGWMREEFLVHGHKRNIRTMVQPVTEDYFATLQATLRGSVWNRDARDGGMVPTVVSESFARELFSSSDVIGRTFQGLEGDGQGPFTLRVTGVVSGLHHWGLDQGSDPTVYVPWERFGAPMSLMTLLVRTSGEPAWALDALRHAVWSEAPQMPLPHAFTVADRERKSLVAPRFYTTLLSVFAAVAVALAAAGTYGAMLYSVERRRHELGIRAAMGAERSSLLGLMMRRSGTLMLLGVVIGTLGALATTRALTRLLFEVTPFDATTFAAAIVLMALVAMAAALSPAMRAARIDPMEVLRTE